MSRGVVYMVWGHTEKIEKLLARSIASLKEIHPELPHEVIRIDGPPDSSALLEKSRMSVFSPFDETLYLDADTVVLGRLDFGFKKARDHGIACSICECPWARRYSNDIGGDTIEYNTGVMFFTKQAAHVFKKWEHLAPKIDSSVVWLDGTDIKKMNFNDQASFACAIDETRFNPFVLPLNWNFRPIWQKTFFGPIKIWHDYNDAPVFFKDIKECYGSKDAVIQFHQVTTSADV